MAIKSTIKSALVALVVLTLSSCNALRKPEYYDNEIRDDFCYEIAKAMYYVESEISYGIDYPFVIAFTDSRKERFFETLEDRARRLPEDNWLEETPYKTILQEMSNSSQQAAEVLRYYYSTPVSLSRFGRLPNEFDFRVWTATEINSGIQVKFMLNSEFYYEVEIDEEDAVMWALNLCEGITSFDGITL